MARCDECRERIYSAIHRVSECARQKVTKWTLGTLVAIMLAVVGAVAGLSIATQARTAENTTRVSGCEVREKAAEKRIDRIERKLDLILDEIRKR